MIDPRAQPGTGDDAPLLVEVSRGELIESRHAVAFAAVDAAGRRVAWRGDVSAPVYARSAIKPLQALPLIETGAADRYKLGPAELALACASHHGEPRHVDIVLAWLDRIGLDVADLECGSHLPYHEPSATALIRAGRPPTAAHNNCSGKHTGFLTTAVSLGERARGYIDPSHSVQRRVTRALEDMCGVDLSRAPLGVDGCGIPVLGIPLEKLALGMARLADPGGLPAERRAAVERIRAAVAAEPLMVGGSDAFCSLVMKRLGGRVLIKIGAEGVFCAAIPEEGIGIALKALDGTERAAKAVISHLLERFRLIGAADEKALAALLHPPVLNRAGRIVGAIRVRAAEGQLAPGSG
ncbi:MAG: asparaginase [Rhodospirillales bacterium]|nr:asparaginase [Rhodospirillales bacterium]